MEVATERTWTNFELGPSALHMREYALKEFWQTFVDDRPFHSDAINKHAHVQSKAVFSYAVTVMDKICGRRRKMGRFKIRGGIKIRSMRVCLPKTVINCAFA